MRGADYVRTLEIRPFMRDDIEATVELWQLRSAQSE